MSFCVMPCIVCGKAEIAKIFKTSPSRVVEWKEKGAPISFTGGMYRAEVNALQHWLILNSQ